MSFLSSSSKYTLCLQCDAGRVSRWLCEKCAATCHRGHSGFMPARLIQVKCHCACGHDNSVQLHEPVRRKWDQNQNITLSDRVFNLGSASGTATQQPPSKDQSTDRFSCDTRRKTTAGGNDYILGRQLSSMDTIATGGNYGITAPNASQLAESQLNPTVDFDMYDGTQIAEEGGISIAPPGSRHQQIAAYQFFQNNPDSAAHTNMSGRNLTPCGLTALSIGIQDGGNGAVVGGFSIAYLLALLYRCSRGETEKELQTMLGVGNVESDALYRQVDLIDLALRRSGVFKSLNYLVFSMPIREGFSKIAERVTTVGAERWQDVNTQVARLTNGLITSVLDCKPSDSMVLINAIYFKSLWRKKFVKSSTVPMTFRGSYSRQVPMMRQTDKCRYMVADGIGELLEVDYQDGEFCMGFLLPLSSFSLGKIADLDYSKLGICEVNYSVPRFTQKCKIDLTKGYKQLGIQRLFKHPELPYITSASGSAKLSHEAVVIVDEEGTEAAATTVFACSNSIDPVEPSINFILNRSFYYYIRHKPTDTIVFTGYYQ